ncbi:DUF6907 domain-containing protein [Streptomyces sp. NBC_00986]|uniref:DUF6907 domain-containing protein n=1 Tax=Streptomyces sp. NBC_00986 TaxID=2903702 RepID=UPI00386D11E9|nr:hypothetical protein OG504_39415 [Streptomyces sp. NBC_00986]
MNHTVSAAEASATAEEPRTWTFTNRHNGKPMSVTCMDGCTIDHSREIGRDLFPEDVWCWTCAEPMTLPINENGTPEEMAVLNTIIKVEPWSATISQRLPYAVVELIEDQFIENLDPDGYETIINAFADRLDQMRATHARLVEVRAAYMARAARSVPTAENIRSQADEALRRVRGESV